MVKILSIIFILLSSNVLSKTGDVYYCVSDNISQTNSITTKQFTDFKFTFKREKYYIKIKSDTWFTGESSQTKIKNSTTDEEVFIIDSTSDSNHEFLSYVKGDFMYSYSVFLTEDKTGSFVLSIFATCEIF